MHILAGGSSPPLPGFLNSLTAPLNHFGYWAVLLDGLAGQAHAALCAPGAHRHQDLRQPRGE